MARRGPSEHVATRWKDRDGNAQERTDWHRLTCWDKLAEIVGEYVSAGDQHRRAPSIQAPHRPPPCWPSPPSASIIRSHLCRNAA